MLALAEDARQGRIQVLIVNGANPVFALPAAAGIKEALAEIPLIVSLSSFMDETTAMADLILPSHTYLESWGDDFPEPGVGFRGRCDIAARGLAALRYPRHRRHAPGGCGGREPRWRGALGIDPRVSAGPLA